MDKKHEQKEEQIKQEQKQEQKEEQVKQEQKKHVESEKVEHNEGKKLHDLLKQVNELLTSNEKHVTRIKHLEEQINEFNHSFASKIEQKAKQANQIVSEKITELTTKHNHEIQEAKKYQLSKIGGQLADVIDQFSTVVNFPTTDEKIKNYKIGFQMYLQMFHNILNEMGISKIEIKVGDHFDEKCMSVVDTVVDESKTENTIAVVISHPYKMGDRVIKIASVKVFKKH
ncbi:MAG: nucleotide exchange factor GrpE [Mycoplasmataceae bacterium]|jgi:molecular chaperone GrpE|nr:nucleotide exchange factor GrpE [Mycoplasmataceae bacterium]